MALVAMQVDTEALWAKLRDEVSLIPQQPGCNPAASFGHLMGGYEAGYYVSRGLRWQPCGTQHVAYGADARFAVVQGYLWSEVYSADLFSVFETTGVMNEENGLKYVPSVLL